MNIGETVKFITKRKPGDKRNFEHSDRVDIAYPLWSLNGKEGKLVNIKTTMLKTGGEIIAYHVQTDKRIYIVHAMDISSHEEGK